MKNLTKSLVKLSNGIQFYVAHDFKNQKTLVEHVVKWGETTDHFSVYSFCKFIELLYPGNICMPVIKGTCNG